MAARLSFSSGTVRSALRYLLIACAILGAFYCFLLARANWLFEQDTVVSIPQAAELVPYDSAFLSRLAAWQPKRKFALLERAVALNPFDYQALIDLGIACEFQRADIAAAERYYLRAAEVNKMYLPKWTLANFYFRQGRRAEFFRWANAALAITPYSPEPIFLQMWQMSQDANALAKSLPDRPRILLAYSWFLSNTGRSVSLPYVIRRLIHDLPKGDPHAWGRDDLLGTAEDRLLAEGDRDDALAIWSEMVNARWLHDNVPSTARPITDENFRAPAYGHGFDWVPLSAEGVRTEQVASRGELRIEMNGDEPEHCSLIRQYVPLAPNANYRLQWQAETPPGIAPVEGLAWHLANLVSGDLIQSPGRQWIFRTQAGWTLGLLTLDYDRPPGSTRARGTVVLRQVTAQQQ